MILYSSFKSLTFTKNILIVQKYRLNVKDVLKSDFLKNQIQNIKYGKNLIFSYHIMNFDR